MRIFLSHRYSNATLSTSKLHITFHHDRHPKPGAIADHSELIETMRAVAPRIASYSDWKREFLALAQNAVRQAHVLRAGFYYRAAEFFMRADDRDRKNTRDNFLGAVRSVYGFEQIKRHAVPYSDGHVEGFLPAYRFTPVTSKGTIVFFGGFDSYIEELTSAFFYLRDAGYGVSTFRPNRRDHRNRDPTRAVATGHG